MASTFDNDLRLEEMATGENAGSWGTKTNTNLELIADAFGYGTFTIANADTTLTIPDGSGSDNALRSLYLKISSSADLTTTRTLTLDPNTISKLWYIENNTSGGQTITISQGSGANVSILNGQAKLVATDGAGATAAVIDVTQDLAIPDLFIDDDLSLQSDGAIINFGEDADVNLTHVADTGLRLNDAMALQFRDSALSISSSADGQLDIDADTEVEIVAPTVDVDATSFIVSGDVAAATLTIDTDHFVVNSDGDAQFRADSDVRITIGSEGTVGNNTSNWIRADETQMRFNNAGGGYLFETSGTSVLNISSGTATLAGYHIAGNQSTVAGAKILGGKYTSGHVVTLGGMFSSGGPVLGYGVWPDTSAQHNFDSSSSLPLARSAIALNGAVFDFYQGSSQTVTEGGAVTISRTISLGQGVFDFNRNQDDVDFKVRGQNDANVLYVNAGTDRVGINTAGPVARLHVNEDSVLGGTAGDYNRLQRWEAETGNQQHLDVIQIRNADGSDWTTQGMRIQSMVDSTYQAWIQFNGDLNSSSLNHGIAIGTGSNTTYNSVAERMRIDLYGNTTFNLPNNDANFKVETSGDSNTLFVDGGNDFVGIGTNLAYADALNVTGPDNSEYRTVFISADNDQSKGLALAYDRNEDYGVVAAVDNGTGWLDVAINPVGGKIGLGITNLSDQSNSTVAIEGRTTLYNGSTTGGSNLIVDGYSQSQDDHLLVIGTQRSSGGPFIAYGLGQDGSASTWASTYDNFAGSHSVLILNGANLEYKADSGNQNVTVGDPVGLYNYFLTGRGGTYFNADNLSSPDFTVETLNKADMLYVDSGNDTVSINNTQTSYHFGIGADYVSNEGLFGVQRALGYSRHAFGGSSGGATKTVTIVMSDYGLNAVELNVYVTGHKFNSGPNNFAVKLVHVAMEESGTMRINSDQTSALGYRLGNQQAKVGSITGSSTGGGNLTFTFTVDGEYDTRILVEAKGPAVNYISSVTHA